MRTSARRLRKQWGVDIKHGLYHHDGAWYHHLTQFPAALFDPHGYVRFESREEYLKHPQLAHGAHLHVVGGISSIPGYVTVRSDSGALAPKHRKPRKEPSGRKDTFLSPEEIAEGAKYREGGTKVVLVNVYERSRKARRQCIAHHGVACAVCAFEFEASFGKIGAGFIHVHHLRDLASVAAQYEVDPKDDLRPICPNCHAMIHRRSPPFSIDELRAMIVRAK